MADRFIRLSDALAVVQGVREEVRNCESLGGPLNAYEALTLTRTSLSTIVPADARPVVRCKNCIHHYYAVDCAGMCRLGIGNSLLDDDFCSRGESNCGADMRGNETVIL